MDTIRIQINTPRGSVEIDLASERALNADILHPVVAGAACLPQTGYTKILADGTHVPGDDPRTDHVALIDHAAGLIWSVDSLGDEADPDSGLDHAGCIARCASLRLLGCDDWRLPTRAELSGLIDDTRRNPAIDVALFPRVKPTWHWTCTPWIDSSGKASASGAWGVNFGNGGVDYDFRNFRGCALAVRRAGQ